MTNISIVEDRTIPAQGPNVNYESLAQNFFQRQGYVRVRHESAFINFANFYKFSEYYICDILIITHARNLEDAEELVPELDAESERCRRLILRGKSFNNNLTVEKHHFMTIHKPFVRYSYQRAGLPVGFVIRPLILIQEEGQWDYFSGQAARIDVTSMDSETLLFYMERHKDTIRANHPLLLDLKKYRYWKLSNYLLNYGHYLIIGFWVAKLIYTIFEAPFPFSVGGMVALTALLYSGFLGFTYLTYLLFHRNRVRELEEFAPNTPSLVQRAHSPEFEENIELSVAETTLETSIEQETQAVTIQDPEPIPEATLPHNIQPPSTMDVANRLYRPRILNHIRKVLNSHDSTQLSAQSQQLLRNTFCLILGKTQRSIPRCDTLAEYLKLIHQNPTVDQYYDSLSLWVGKLDTKTPFTQDEIEGFKRFLQLFLNNLECLPADLKQKVDIEHARDQLAPAPIPTTLNNPHPLKNQNREAPHMETPQSHNQRQIEDLKRQVAGVPSRSPQNTPNGTPELTIPPPPTPNLEVATIPQSYHSEIAGINLHQFNKIRESEKNGIYCVLIIDSSQPDTPRIIEQFTFITKNLDVFRNIHDLHTDRDPLLEREFGNTNPPAIMVGCGKNSETVPYGERGDDGRLHSVVASYHRPACAISLRKKAEDESSGQKNKESALVMEGGTPEAQDMERSPPIPSRLPPLEKTSPTIPPPPNPPPIVEKMSPPIATEVQTMNNINLTSQKLVDKAQWDTNLKNFQKGSVFIDGSNLIFLFKDYKLVNGARLDCIYEVINTITALGVPRDKISVYFDANIEYKLKKDYPADLPRLREGIQRGEFRKVPSKTEGDTSLIALAEQYKRKFVVLSNDQFNKKPEWFCLHRIGVGLSPENHPYLAIESVKAFLKIFYGANPTRQSDRQGGLVHA